MSADSDFCGNRENRKSITGFVILLKKFLCLGSLLSTGAKYVAVLEMHKQIISLYEINFALSSYVLMCKIFLPNQVLISSYKKQYAYEGQPWKMSYFRENKVWLVEPWKNCQITGSYCCLNLTQDTVSMGWYFLKSAFTAKWASPSGNSSEHAPFASFICPSVINSSFEIVASFF